MIQISKPEDWPLKEYPENGNDCEMKLSHYTVVTNYKNGYILHHTITWSMFYLTAEEYQHIFENEKFIKYRIVLDKDIDEDPIAERVYLRRAQWSHPFTYDKINGYVIMTTTACNARCPYCYEQGLKAINMTKKTAENVVQFIKKKHTKDVTIRWFGGEPLLNTKIMDYISDRLAEEGIPYSSTMISNSSLLYKCVDHFEKWNLKSVQVTFDGVKEKYDEIKNYVGVSGSTFDKVVEGIRTAVEKSEAHISIRINISFENLDTLEETLSYIRSEFAEYLKSRRVSVYVAAIFEIRMEETGEDFVRLSKQAAEIVKKYPDVVSQSLTWYPELTKKMDLSYCSASKGGGMVINPLGEITPCEHWHGENVIGNVVDGITASTETLEDWRIKSTENIEFCKKMRCPLLPTCNHYHKCEASPRCKNEHRFNLQIDEKKKSLVTTFEYYLQKVADKKRRK